jgi:hypothetical protein
VNETETERKKQGIDQPALIEPIYQRAPFGIADRFPEQAVERKEKDYYYAYRDGVQNNAITPCQFFAGAFLQLVLDDLDAGLRILLSGIRKRKEERYHVSVYAEVAHPHNFEMKDMPVQHLKKSDRCRQKQKKTCYNFFDLSQKIV